MSPAVSYEGSAVSHRSFPVFIKARLYEPKGEVVGTWYLFRHADCQAALRNPCLSLEPADPGDEILRERATLRSRLLTLWQADQTRIRDLMDRAAADVLAEVLATRNTFNVKWDFAIPVANRVFSAVLGLPDGDADLIREWLRNNAAANAQQSARGFRGFARYLSVQVERKRPDQAGRGPAGDGTGDLLTGLLAAVDASAPRARVVANLAWLILGLGWDLAHPVVSTGTVLLTGAGVDRPALTAGTVNEVFRLFDPTPTFQEDDPHAEVGQPLFAKQDTSVGALDIHKGDVVRVDLGRANRDPAVFEAPDRFDAARPPGRIAWELPGAVFPTVVFVRPQVEACLNALFAAGARLADPEQSALLRHPMRLRGEGLTVASEHSG